MKFTNKELNYEHIRCFFVSTRAKVRHAKDAAGLLVLPGNRAHVSAQPLWPRLPQFCPTSDPASACDAAFGFFFWFSVPRLLRVVPAVLLCSARQSPVHERPFSLLPPDLHAPSPPPPSLPSAKGSVLPPPLLRPPLPPHLRRSPLAQAPALTPTGSAACPRPYCLASLTPLLFAALLLWISSAATATCVLLYNAARVEQFRRLRASRCSLGRLGSEPGPAGAGTRCSAAAARSGRGQGPCGSEARGRAGSRGQARRLALLPRDIQGNDICDAWYGPVDCAGKIWQAWWAKPCMCQRLAFEISVWQKLEEENREFFKAYYMRLMLKSQIMVFNRLFEDQYRLMRKEHPAGVPSMPSTAPNVCNSGTLQAGELLRCCHSINWKKIRTPHLTMVKYRPHYTIPDDCFVRIINRHVLCLCMCTNPCR